MKQAAFLGQLCAEAAIAEYQIGFKTQKIGQRIQVETLRQAESSSFQESLGVCSYRLPKG